MWLVKHYAMKMYVYSNNKFGNDCTVMAEWPMKLFRYLETNNSDVISIISEIHDDSP
jgi:hypothetical protein